MNPTTLPLEAVNTSLHQTREPKNTGTAMRDVARFTDFIQAHIEKTDEHRIFIDKETTKKIADESHVEIPECYQIVKEVKDIKFDILPDCFIIKPTHLSSKKGVYALFRIQDKFFELFSNRILTKDEISSELSGVISKQATNVMVEEFITGENGSVEIPYDYKLYTFDSGVHLIAQINRNVTPNEMCIYDGEFKVLDASSVSFNEDYISYGEPKIPRNHEQLIERAIFLHSKLNRPFISVDLFTTGDRVVLGELTPGPGGPYYGSMFTFSPELDHYLGKLQLDGYRRRGWKIPQVEKFPPSRVKDSLFS
jgi:hypothetical protein